MKNHPLRNPSTTCLAAALALVLVPAVGSTQSVPAGGVAPGYESATATPIPITKLQASTEARRGNDPDEGATARPEPRRPRYEYESALDAYTMFEESEGPDWVGANDRVGEIGGWKTYAREMYETAADGDEPMGEASDDGASE